ncbi:su(var)2-HP2 isoform X2 [Musca autumnalis]|uniref:su(var)2-HP2 isoform X2 n=1 Tax=Musca autumnalis TaxID=221902 RepID=UPI003CF68697
MKMEEIEYLEEYEDIVIRNTAINPGAAEALKTTKTNENLDDEGSSSSLDQDIFNCLFDDNSDDDNEEQVSKSELPKTTQKCELRTSLDSLELLNDLGEQVAKEYEINKSEVNLIKNTVNTEKNTSSKSKLVNAPKIEPKGRTATTTTKKTIPKKLNVGKEKIGSVSLVSDKSKPRLTTFPSRGPLPSTSKVLKKSIVSKTPIIKHRPATIVKPEKIITSDPAEDPLNLDEVSSTESANLSSVSDITGETYNSISEFDDDDYDFTSHIENIDDESSSSQIIDISNDSSGSRSKFDFLRGSTPSPVVSEDRDEQNVQGSSKEKSSPKIMANHEIIKNLMKKEGKPKLLQLINEQESKNSSKTDTSMTGCSQNSRDTDSGESQDSYLSVVNEMLEESYAEAMRNKHETMANQEVGAEMEISVEETTEKSTSVEEKTNEAIHDNNGQFSSSNIVEKSVDISITETAEKQQANTSISTENVLQIDKSSNANALPTQGKSSNKIVSDIESDNDLDEREFQGFAEVNIKDTLEKPKASRMDIRPKEQDCPKKLQDKPETKKEMVSHESIKISQSKVTQEVAKNIIRNPFVHRKVRNVCTTEGTTKIDNDSKSKDRATAFDKTSAKNLPSSRKSDLVHRDREQKNDTSKHDESGSKPIIDQQRDEKANANAIKADSSKTIPIQSQQENVQKTLGNKDVSGSKEIIDQPRIEKPNKTTNSIKADSSKTNHKQSLQENVKTIENNENKSCDKKQDVDSVQLNEGTKAQTAVVSKSNVDQNEESKQKNAKGSEIILDDEGNKVEKNICTRLGKLEGDKTNFEETPRDVNKDLESSKSSEKKSIGKGMPSKQLATAVQSKSNKADSAITEKYKEPKDIVKTGNNNKTNDKSDQTKKVPENENRPESNTKKNFELKSTTTKDDQRNIEKDAKKTKRIETNQHPKELSSNKEQLNVDQHSLGKEEEHINADKTKRIETNQHPKEQSSNKEQLNTTKMGSSKVEEKSPGRTTRPEKKTESTSIHTRLNKVVDFETISEGDIEKHQSQGNKIVKDALEYVGRKIVPEKIDEDLKEDSTNTEDPKRIIRKTRGTKQQSIEKPTISPQLGKTDKASENNNDNLIKCSPRNKKKGGNVTSERDELMAKELQVGESSKIANSSHNVSEPCIKEHVDQTAENPKHCNSRRGRMANESKVEKIEDSKKTRSEIQEVDASKNIPVTGNVDSPIHDKTKKIKKTMLAMADHEKHLKEQSADLTVSISVSPKKPKSTTKQSITNENVQHHLPALHLQSSSVESSEEDRGDKQKLKIPEGNFEKNGTSLERAEEELYNSTKRTENTKNNSLSAKSNPKSTTNKEHGIDTNALNALPNNQKEKFSPTTENPDKQDFSPLKEKSECVEQVRSLRKRTLESPAIGHKSELSVGLEGTKKRLRSPAHEPETPQAKRTKSDRNARIRNMVTEKSSSMDGMNTLPSTDANPTTETQLDFKNIPVTTELLAETPSTSTVKNRTDVFKPKLADKGKSTEKKFHSDKRGFKLPKNKSQSSRSSVLSFAEWMDKNNQNEVTEEKTIESSKHNVISQKQIEAKSSACKFESEISQNPSLLKKNERKTPQIDDKQQNQGRTTISEVDILDQNVSSSQRSRKKRRTIGPVQQSSRTKQKIDVSRPSSASPTKGDKAKNKRTEIDKLIESMSKEMKDGGIEDLLNRSDHVKRQRVSSKKNKSTTDLMAAPEKSLTSKENTIDKPNTITTTGTNKSKTARDTPKSHNNCQSISNVKFKKPIAPKDQRFDTICSASILSIETEKALIDEIEIINMNSSLLEPLKYGTPEEQPKNANKVNKPPPTNNKYASNTCRRNNSKLNTIGLQSIKCRKLKVRINRRVVNNYLRNLKKADASQAVLNRGCGIRAKQGNVLPTSMQQNDILPEVRVQAVGKSIQLEENAQICYDVSENKTGKNTKTLNRKLPSTKDGGPPTILPHILPSSHVVETRTENIPSTCSAKNGNASLQPSQPGVIRNPTVEQGIPVELKHEFLDETPGGTEDCILPDTSTLLARSHSITQAAANALSNTSLPTDIRLLTGDPLTNIRVPSFGVTPTLIDAKGTRMYTFLHPAKYSRNHGNVLLDYCCPNLDGPMPAIDPTRIHSQVQTPVVELPECIVLTTKVVTLAELESNSTNIPEFIRRKAEKLRSSITTQHSQPMPSGTPPVVRPAAGLLQEPGRMNQIHPQLPLPPTIPPTTAPLVMRPPHLSPGPHLSPTLNALTKYLPSTTTITPKIRPSLQQTLTNPKASVSVVPKGLDSLNDMNLNLLRTNLRRFDIMLKNAAQPFDKLTFMQRHQIMENIISSGKFYSKNLEWSLVFMEEYLKQINSVSSHDLTSDINSPAANNQLPPIQMPPLSAAANMVAAPISAPSHRIQVQTNKSTAIRKQQSSPPKKLSVSVNVPNIRKHKVPIYDTEKNIIGYQLQVVTPPNSTTSSSTPSKGILRQSEGKPVSDLRKASKRPAQGSPQIFYTAPPLQQPTPTQGHLNALTYNLQQDGSNKPSSHQHGSILTTMRSAGSTNASTETITTTTMEVKRVTRSRASGVTGSKIIIMSKSNINEEAILPDVSHRTEIKSEQDDANEFVG